MKKRASLRLFLAIALTVTFQAPARADDTKRKLTGTACLEGLPEKEGCREGIRVQAQQPSGKPQVQETVSHGAFTIPLDQGDESDPWIVVARYWDPKDPATFYIGQPQGPVRIIGTGGDKHVPMTLKRKSRPVSTSILLAPLPAIDWGRISAGGSGPSAEDGQNAPSAPQAVTHDFRVSVWSADVPASKGRPAATGRTLRRATVSLVELNGNKVINGLTDSSGSFQAVLPAPSAYGLTVSARHYVSQAFVVAVDARGIAIADANGDWSAPGRIVLDAQRPASAGELISTRFQDADGARQTADSPALIESLPLPPVRSVDSLALLEPGVVPPAESYRRRGPGVAPGLGTAGQFSVNGLRSRENNFTVDGADNNDEDTGVRRQGFLIPLAQPIESLAMFQIVTSNPDVRSGRAIGGQINILSKLAGNSFHGELYGFGASSALNARDYFNAAGRTPGATAEGRLPITTSGLPGGAPVSIDAGSFRLPGIASTGGVASQSAPDFRQDAQSRLQFGAAVGGPIVPNRSYAFVSFERLHVSSSKTLDFATPTIAQRILPSLPQLPAIPGFPPSLFPATLSGNAVFSLYPFPNNAGGPFGPNTFTARLPADAEGTIYSVKLDQALNRTATRSLMVRFNGTSEGDTVPAAGGAIDSTVRPEGGTQNAVAVLTTSFPFGLSNIFRFSYGRTHMSFDEVRDATLLPSSLFPDHPFLLNRPMLLNVTSAGETVKYVSPSTPTGRQLVSSAFGGFNDTNGTTEPYLGAIGEVRIAGFSPVGLDSYHFPQDRLQQTYQWSDGWSIRRGRHLLQGGFDIRRLRLDTVTERNSRPLLEFHGMRQLPAVSATALPPSQLLFSPLELAAGGVYAGLMQTLGVTTDFSLRLHRTTVDMYFMDQFHASPRLSLTFGIRIAFNRLPKDLDPRLQAAFDANAFRAEVAKAQQTCPASGPAQQTCLDVIGGAQAQLSGNLQETYGRDRMGNDPRVAFAWDMSGTGSSILRGGFGVYTAQFPTIVLNESRSTFPSFAPLNLGVNFASLISSANFATPSPGGRLAATLGTIDTANPNTPNLLALIAGRFGGALQLTQPAKAIKNPYAYQYNLTWDHSTSSGYGIEMAYAGTAAHHLLRAWTPYGGAYVPGIGSYLGIGYFPGFSPFPSFTAAGPQTTPAGERFGRLPVRRTLLEGTANSNYNSLQAAISKRLAGPITFRSALTYGHAIDDASDFFDLPSGEALAQNSSRRSERGSSSYDARLRSVTYATFEMPLTRNRRWLRDWNLSGILTLQTGQPFTAGTVTDWNADGNLTDRIQDAGAIRMGPVGGDRRVMLQAAGATLPALRNADGSLNFSEGAVGRNTWRAGGIADIDLASSVAIFRREDFRVTFRAEAYNVFNRAHFGVPVRMVEAPGFGTSVATTVPNREIQLALKISF